MIILNVLERIFNILFTISIIISAVAGTKKSLRVLHKRAQKALFQIIKIISPAGGVI